MAKKKSSSGLMAGALLFVILITVAIIVLMQGPAQGPPSDDAEAETPKEEVDPFAALPPENALKR